MPTPIHARCTRPVLTICSAYAARRFDGTAKPMPWPASDDHRVDAEHLAVEVAERTARVARIDAGVGLEVSSTELMPRPPRPFALTHAGGHRVAEAERRADRDHPLADACGVAVGELCGASPFASTRMTARSVAGSRPRSRADSMRPSRRRTLMDSASSMTWLFVRIAPSVLKTTPEPIPRCTAVSAFDGFLYQRATCGSARAPRPRSARRSG